MAAKKFSEYKPQIIEETHVESGHTISLGDYLLDLGYGPSFHEKIMLSLSDREGVNYTLDMKVIQDDDLATLIEESFNAYKENEFSFRDMYDEGLLKNTGLFC